MDFKIFNLLKNKESLWVSAIFYCVSALLIIIIFTYFLFVYKVYIQNKEMSEIDIKIANYSVGQDKTYEKKVLDYQKKINDYIVIINSHKISSSVFSFIEEKTLLNVWFSDFDMSQSINEIRLSGQTDSLETFSRQIQVFEKSKDYVEKIDVLDSQVESSGKIKFTLSLSLNPQIFTYIKPPSTLPSNN